MQSVTNSAENIIKKCKTKLDFSLPKENMEPEDLGKKQKMLLLEKTHLDCVSLSNLSCVSSQVQVKCMPHGIIPNSLTFLAKSYASVSISKNGSSSYLSPCY